MKSEDKNEFAKQIAILQTIYQKTFKLSQTKIYWYALSEYSIEEVSIGIKRHIQDPEVGQFLPKPADIIRNIVGTHSEEALQEWGTVIKYIEKAGQYQTVSFHNPIVARVIEEMGGWIKLCMLTNQELPFKFKEFEQRYKVCRRRGDTTHSGLLSGIFKCISPIEIKTGSHSTMGRDNDFMMLETNTI